VKSFAKHGITYHHSSRDRSAIYGDVLPLFTSGRVRLLDNRRLVAQFAALERRTSAAGRDRIDHPPHMHDDLSNSCAGTLVAAVDQRNRASLVAPIICYAPAPGSQFDHPGFGGGY